MSGLSVRGHRLALEINRAIDDGDTRRVVDLVDSYGLHRTERLAVCRELEKPDGEDVTFRYGPFDLAHVRDLPTVWQRGIASR